MQTGLGIRTCGDCFPCIKSLESTWLFACTLAAVPMQWFPLRLQQLDAKLTVLTAYRTRTKKAHDSEAPHHTTHTSEGTRKERGGQGCQPGRIIKPT